MPAYSRAGSRAEVSATSRDSRANTLACARRSRAPPAQASLSAAPRCRAGHGVSRGVRRVSPAVSP
eukprot:4511621-Prymnesium_polylepis.1